MRKSIFMLSLLAGLMAHASEKETKENDDKWSESSGRFFIEKHEGAMLAPLYLIKDIKTNKEFLYFNKAMVEITKDKPGERK